MYEQLSRISSKNQKVFFKKSVCEKSTLMKIMSIRVYIILMGTKMDVQDEFGKGLRAPDMRCMKDDIGCFNLNFIIITNKTPLK